jgi:hypothetical protein
VSEIDDFDDFREQMFWAVHEGWFLFELPGGVRDHTRDGIVQHGPWPPEECTRCLRKWFDSGWIELYVLSEHLNRWASDEVNLIRDPSDENMPIVERGRARAILMAPLTWKNDRPEGLVCLAPTDQAPPPDARQIWLDAIAPAE